MIIPKSPLRFRILDTADGSVLMHNLFLNSVMRMQLSGAPRALRLEFEKPILNRPPDDRSPHSELNKVIPETGIYSMFTGITEKETLVDWFEYDVLGNISSTEFGLKVILWSEEQGQFRLYRLPYEPNTQSLDLSSFTESSNWRVIGNCYEPRFK